jgi:hypothetical protein
VSGAPQARPGGAIRRAVKPPDLREFALSEVRQAPNALGAGAFVFDALLDLAAERRTAPTPGQVLARWSARRLDPRDGETSVGSLAEILSCGPRSQEELAILNCFFAVGTAHRMSRLPTEKRKRFAHDLVRQADFLLSETAYSPFEYLPRVAPPELGAPLWEALVSSLIEETNRLGEAPGAAALLRALALRHLPAEVRRAYTRRILSECREPEAALRYLALFTSLEESRDEPEAHRARQPATPPPLPESGERREAGGPLDPRPASPAEAPLPPVLCKPEAVACVRGEVDPGPAGLVLRGLLLVSGLSLLGDLLWFLARALGLRRTTTLHLARGELLAEERVQARGRTFWQRRRSYAALAVARVVQEVPYGRLYLLLGLSLLTLCVAFAVPFFFQEDVGGWRPGLLAACAAVLAGIALDLTRFLFTHLQRGHCAVTVGLDGGETFRLVGVPKPAVARFAEAARALRSERSSCTSCADSKATSGS